MRNFHQENADLLEEKERLVKRIEKLRNEFTQAQKSVDALAYSLGADTLAEKDTTEKFEDLAHKRMRFDALDEAISQAKKRIGEIDFQYAYNKKLSAMTSFDQGANEAHSRFLKCIAQLYDVTSEMKAIKEKIDSLNANSEGISMENRSDETRLLENLLKFFMSDSTESISQKLQTIEQSYPAIASQVWAIKSR